MALLIRWFYGVSVTNFGVAKSYADLTWTYCVAIMFHGLVGTVVQVSGIASLMSMISLNVLTQWFFSWRVWSVSGRIYLAIPPAVVSIVRCGLAFFIAIKFGTVGEEGFHAHYQWAFIVAQALNTGVSSLFAASP
jgi:hypothetical protein